MEKDIIEKYFATILVGDEYHEVGEEHILRSWEIEETKKHGLRLEIKRNGWGEVFYHLYPCSIRKITYKLEPIDISTIEGGDRNNADYKPGGIGVDKITENNDWENHWC